MKVIDLLNKIANGIDIPLHIKYDNDIWKYDEMARDYLFIDKSGEEFLIGEELNLTYALNDEVEITEEDKKIEKPSILKTINLDYNLENDYYDHLDNRAIVLDITTLKHHINKIIDYLEENNNGDSK